MTGKKLPNVLDTQARQTEMKQVCTHKLYDKVPLTESYEVTGEGAGGTKWLESDKGYDEDYNIRARLVAQKYSKGKSESIFASIGPWEAKTMLLSLAVKEGVGYGPGWHYKIDCINIKRAYFYAPANRNVYIQLPMDDAEEGMCGKSREAMYGTRDASLIWEEEYVRFMESVGFTEAIRLSSPSLFYLSGKDMRAVVYGDDFIILGAEHKLDWFKSPIKEVHEIDFKARLGPDDGDTKVVRLLNRIVIINNEWKYDVFFYGGGSMARGDDR